MKLALITLPNLALILITSVALILLSQFLFKETLFVLPIAVSFFLQWIQALPIAINLHAFALPIAVSLSLKWLPALLIAINHHAFISLTPIS